ncbi:MAG: sulfotransferase, partial [Candidatus Binatia bacterium]
TQRRSGSYSYAITGQWQGRFERIRVIGDKHGERTTKRLRANPWLLRRLRETVGIPVKFVHVVRNPFDNIATIASRAAKSGTPDLAAALQQYFMLCETVGQLKEQVAEGDVVECRHETLIENPVATLRELCLALRLEPSPEYLAACAGIVYESPHKSRDQVQWHADLRREVERSMEQFPFLHGYTFEE